MASARTWKYGQMPSVYIPRSQQDLSHNVLTSMSIGKLYPIDWFETLPNDSIACDQVNVSRLTSSFIRPVYGDIYLDTYHFYVPYRILYDKWESIFGDSNPSQYTEPEYAFVPFVDGSSNVVRGSVADYLGLPVGIQGGYYSILPFRAFALVYNEFFRNENIQDQVLVQKGETAASEVINGNAWAPNNYTGLLPSVNKFRDYFTSCLPSPQKGEPVTFGVQGKAPINTTATEAFTFDESLALYPPSGTGTGQGYFPAFVSAGPDRSLVLSTDKGVTTLNEAHTITGSNMYADLSKATQINVNDFRAAVAAQRVLERDAIFGTRYPEYLRGHWNVFIDEDTIQWPVYLGGGRTTLDQIQVAQTSSSASESATDTPLATLSAYTWSTARSRFRRKVKEHGMILTVACLRYKHMYQQGLDRKWTRKMREDFYDPLYATIGMQPVYTYELYGTTATASKKNVFGYQEAWMTYRVLPNKVTGQMRSDNKAENLDVYHFADNYSSAPTLSDSFIKETPTFVDRSLTVPSTSMDQFVLWFNFRIKAVRNIIVSSYPGLVDHH